MQEWCKPQDNKAFSSVQPQSKVAEATLPCFHNMCPALTSPNTHISCLCIPLHASLAVSCAIHLATAQDNAQVRTNSLLGCKATRKGKDKVEWRDLGGDWTLRWEKATNVERDYLCASQPENIDPENRRLGFARWCSLSLLFIFFLQAVKHTIGRINCKRLSSWFSPFLVKIFPFLEWHFCVSFWA